MPVLIATPFATNGTKNDIPETTGAQPQNATMDEGFPAITQQPISTGGIPPERADFNGILYALSDNISHINKGLAYSFDTTFATKIGGYPLHAELVLADGTRVVSTVANNMNDPDVDLTGWRKGVPASNVIDESGNTQQFFNSKISITVQTIKDLIDFDLRVGGITVRTKSFYADYIAGGSEFYWSSTTPKSQANGGTIIDPSSTGGFDGTYATIESFLLAQGTGTGSGCWVSNNTKAKATRFGLHNNEFADISGPLNSVIKYAANSREAGDVILPAGVLRLRKKVSFDFDGDITKSIKIRGQASQTQIMSTVVGQPSIELIDAVGVFCEDFMLYGNDLLDSFGSGHGIAFRAVDNQYPSSCGTNNVVCRRFKGFDKDGDGATIRSAGIFVDKGVSNSFNKTTCKDNFTGMWFYQTQQTALRDYIGFDNMFANVFGHQVLDTFNIYNPDVIGLSNPETTITIGSDVIPAAGVICYNSEAAIKIQDSKAKGNGTFYRFTKCRKVTLEGGWMRLPNDNNYAIVIDGAATAWDFTARDVLFSSQQTASANLKAIYAKSQDTSRFSQVNLDACRVHFVDKWDTFLHVENASSSDRTRFSMAKCSFFAHEGAYESSIQNVIKVTNGVVNGDVSGNSFAVRGTATNNNKISNIITSDSTSEWSLTGQGNTYITQGTGVITNRMPLSRVEGVATSVTVTAGNAYVPINLNAKPVFVTGQLNGEQPTGNVGLYITPAAQAGQTKSQLIFRVFNRDGTNYTGTINLYYSASTAAGLS